MRSVPQTLGSGVRAEQKFMNEPIPATMVFTHSTVAAIAGYLLNELFPLAAAAVEES